MTDFRITVIVDPARAVKGSKQVEGALVRTDNAADRLRSTLNRAFSIAAIGLAARQIIALGDTFTNIQNRLKTVTDGTAELATVTERLFGIANNTRSSFEGTAELYARVGLAARELGIEQDQLLNFTESVNQAVILSGASAQEASAGLIQLSQGLASGALRGDELRSVLEQLPVVADVIADSLGVTRGKLRELGTEGAITAEVVLNAFGQAREELAGRFAEAALTVGQAFVILRNRVIEFVGSVDTSTGVFGAFAQAVLFLANNLEFLVQVIQVLIPALAILAGRAALGAVINAMRALTALIAANPLGALVLGIVTLISFIVQFRNELGLTNEFIGNTIAFVGQLVTSIEEAIAAVLQLFGLIDGGGGSSIGKGIQGLGKAIAEGGEEAGASILDAGSGAAEEMNKAITNGGKSAAGSIASGMASGAAAASRSASNQAARAQAQFENLNGRAVKEIGDTLVKGGDYISNEVTGSVTKAGEGMGQSIESGGAGAGASMKNSIVQGGQQAGAQIFQSVESAFATLGPLGEVFAAFRRQQRAELALIRSESGVNSAERELLLAQASEINSRPRSGGGGGSGSFSSRGGSGGGGGSNEPLPGTVDPLFDPARFQPKISITNVTDPNASVNAISTGKGNAAVVNVIKGNKEEILRILGVA